MTFKDKNSPSLGPKILLIVCMSSGIVIPALMMFSHDKIPMAWFDIEKIVGNFSRQILILTGFTIYLLRFSFTAFILIKRKIGWFEGCLTSFLFYMMFFLFNTMAGQHSESLNVVDFLAVLLYIVGSVINAMSDYQRFVFKGKPENKGRLFTGGLFRFSMHINYFGDALMYIALALITMESVCLLVSLAITLNFIFIQIPMLDKHLRNSYCSEFTKYAESTKRFIPGIY